MKTAAVSSEHLVRFYEDDAGLMASIATFLGEALNADGAAVLIATERHRRGVTELLRARGHDLAGLARAGRFFPLDAAQMLRAAWRDGRPDREGFRTSMGSLLAEAVRPGRPLHVFGEMVALLCATGDGRGTVALERMWNELLALHDARVLCAYPIAAFASEEDARLFTDLCAEHGRVLPSESYGELASSEGKVRRVAELQQRAIALATEVAKRLATEETLRRREQELAAALQVSRDGVLDVDASGTIVWTNEAFLRLTGRDASDVGPETSISDLLLDRRVFDEMWLRLARGESVAGTALALRSPDGTARTLRVLSGVLRTVGRAAHMRCLLRD